MAWKFKEVREKVFFRGSDKRVATKWPSTPNFQDLRGGLSGYKVDTTLALPGCVQPHDVIFPETTAYKRDALNLSEEYTIFQVRAPSAFSVSFSVASVARWFSSAFSSLGFGVVPAALVFASADP